MAGSETAPKMAAPFWHTHTHTHFNALAVNYFVVACHSNQRFGLPLALIIVIIFAGSSELANAAGKSLQGTRCQMKAPPPHAPFFSDPREIAFFGAQTQTSYIFITSTRFCCICCCAQ